MPKRTASAKYGLATVGMRLFLEDVSTAGPGREDGMFGKPQPGDVADQPDQPLYTVGRRLARSVGGHSARGGWLMVKAGKDFRWPRRVLVTALSVAGLGIEVGPAGRPPALLGGAGRGIAGGVDRRVVLRVRV